MADRSDAAAPITQQAHAAGPAPIPAWPGTLVRLATGAVFVRQAPASAGAAPAVFVHGLGGSATNWTDLMGLLAKPCRDAPALAGEAVDLPGFGFSPPSADDDYSLDAQAATVIALIEGRRGRPVHLIGNSLGGAVSTRVAAWRPDLVRSLTLISPALPDLRPRPLPLRLALVSVPGLGDLLIKRLARIPAEQRTEMTINDLYADPALLSAERRAEAVAEVLRRDALGYSGRVLLRSGRALVAEYARARRGSLWRDAARVTAPTLVLHGSHDRLVNPATAARAARTFRNCRVVVLPRVGHVAMMERPDLVAAEMRGFLSSQAVTAAGRRSTLSRVSS